MSRAVGQNWLNLYGEQNSLTPLRNKNLNFGLARDKVVLLITATNLCASRRQASYWYALFPIYEWEGITKTNVPNDP